ncbi:MAG: hypothetical protein H8E15_12500 [Planctomycetes bacterium]|nr:hypothetical protein [Planctomycetota bacterium]
MSYFLRISLIAVITVFSTLPAFSQEGRILSVWGELFAVDLKHGTTSSIGSTGHHSFQWNGLAMNSQGQLFGASGDWIAGWAIYQISPNDGSASFITSTPLTEVGSMAFGQNDQLFVAHDPVWPGGGGLHELYSVDLSTGTATLIGSTGTRDLLAMDFHDGVLYGYTASHGLVRIETSTGAATDVNLNFLGPLDFGFSMCFDDLGALYYVDGGLWMMDRDSGIRHPVGWMDYYGYWGEMVYYDSPNQNFSLWLNGTTGHYMQAKMTGITPNGKAVVLWAKGEGGPTPIPSGLPCAGTMMDLNSNMQKLSIVTADANGEAVLGPGPKRVPAAAAGLIWLQAIDLTTCETSNKVLFWI